MTIQKRENQTFAESGISEIIHICNMNGLQITTSAGSINIEKFLREALKHHCELIQQYRPLDANDYPELDYRLHVSLMKKELKDEIWGGSHG